MAMVLGYAKRLKGHVNTSMAPKGGQNASGVGRHAKGGNAH